MSHKLSLWLVNKKESMRISILLFCWIHKCVERTKATNQGTHWKLRGGIKVFSSATNEIVVLMCHKCAAYHHAWWQVEACQPEDTTAIVNVLSLSLVLYIHLDWAIIPPRSIYVNDLFKTSLIYLTDFSLPKMIQCCCYKQYIPPSEGAWWK